MCSIEGGSPNTRHAEMVPSKIARKLNLMNLQCLHKELLNEASAIDEWHWAAGVGMQRLIGIDAHLGIKGGRKILGAIDALRGIIAAGVRRTHHLATWDSRA